ncbi:hypothetical protein ACFWHT_09725 [Microbacterium sp. NPDC058342]|uniref:hypothetical protein n=1 Tax=Microbacterium sp. NPDC058342 TaxID=3346454 RepID=UPI003669045D
MESERVTASATRLRAWSAARWVVIGVVCAVQGLSGWYFTLFDVHGLDDFDGSLAISMIAFPVNALLFVLDFRTARARGAFWAWIALRGIAVPLVGVGVGSLARVWLVGAGGGDLDPDAVDFAWHLAALGAALLALQPVTAGIRRAAVAAFGPPRQASAESIHSPADDAPVRESDSGSSGSTPPLPPKWPGSPRIKAIAGALAFVVVAATMLTVAGRVYWHVAVETWASVPPMVATGTLDGREVAVVTYDERAFLRISEHERVAAIDLGTGELIWDQRLPKDHDIPVGVDAVAVDERGAFIRMDDPTRAATWFALDARTGRIAMTATEGNLQVVDDLGTAAPGIPGEIVQRYVDRDGQGVDDGYDDEFTDDADLERVFRYDDESLVIEPVTGRPAGEEHGFTLHTLCCRPSALEARGPESDLLWSLEGASPSARDVVAQTPGGRVVIMADGPESKGRLIIGSISGHREVVIGDRGWLPW